MSKPWPKATIESDRPVRQRSDTKALYRLGDKLVEAHEMESLRRESGTHPVSRDPDSAPVSIEPPARTVDVLLWFEEIEEPVRARAELQGTRLRMRAPLSLLRIGAQLHYTVIESGAVATARVERLALASEPGPAIPILELELHGDAPPAIETSRERAVQADMAEVDEPAAVTAAPDGVTAEAVAAKPAAASPSRAGRWFGLLCAGALGVAGGAAATKRFADEHYTQRIAAEREIAARELAAMRAAQLRPVPFRVVPDAPIALPPPAPAPSLLRHEVLPVMDALEVAAPAPAAPPSAAEPKPDRAPPHADGDRLPRVTVEDQLTTIVIPMRGSGDGMKSYPLSTPGLVLTLPKAFSLIPPGNHEPPRGLARRIGVRKLGAGTQVKVLYRSMAVRPRIAYDPAVGVAITLQRTW